MNIFDFERYQDFLEAYQRSHAKRGHGLLSRWAKQLSVSTTLLSQIFRGHKLMSLEIAEALARSFELSPSETDYLLLLTELERAGTRSLKAHFKMKCKEAQNAARFMKNRVHEITELSGEAKAQYYSSWIYAGVRNLLACPDTKSIEALATRLHLPRVAILEVFEFLIRNALLVESAEGWVIGPASTYIPSDSPLVANHHQNWRLKAISQLSARTPEDLYYTSPMSLSESVAKKIRTDLVAMIESIHKKTDPSDSEVVRCLNIDWFEY